MNRTRDLLWEALVKTCRADDDEMTKSERGRYNKALKELREAGATPEEIEKRGRQYRRTYPDSTMTPTALAAHWSALRPAPSPYPRSANSSGTLNTGNGLVKVTPDGDPPDENVSPEQRQENLRKLRELIESVGKDPDAGS